MPIKPIPVINADEWFSIHKDLGWTIVDSSDTMEPNPYGDGMILVCEFHWNDEKNHYAGTFVTEVWKKRGEAQLNQYFVPFTLSAAECI